VIQKHLVDRLALGLLQGEFSAGDTIVVGAADRELTFTQSPAATPAAA
jgi:ATP-dependent Clp protease ATP-binding subunit ClpB